MVSEKKLENTSVYVCDICGLGYGDYETAKRCEDYCDEHHSCSIEITAEAIYYPTKPGIKTVEHEEE